MSSVFGKAHIALPHLLCLVLVLLLYSNAGAASAPIPAADYSVFSAAKQALDDGRLGVAKDKMAHYFRSHKNRHQFAYELYGHLLLLSNANSEALAVYQTGVSKYPEQINLLQNLAVAYGRNDLPAEAANTYLQAYEVSSNTKPQFAFSAAVLFSQLSEYSRAIELLGKLIDESEEIEANWALLLGQCYLQLEDNGNAIAVLTTASRQFSGNEKIWQLLALSYYRADQSDYAAAAFKIANTIDAGSKQDAEQLGTLFIQLGAAYSGALMVSPGAPELQDGIVYQLIKVGDLVAALKQAETLQQQSPTQARQFLIAQTLVRLDRFAEAEKKYLDIAGKQGKYQIKSQWELVLLGWRNADWSLVYQRLLRLGQLDEKMKAQTAQLTKIVGKIMPLE